MTRDTFRQNNIILVLTLVNFLLLPSAVIGGIWGMNVTVPDNTTGGDTDVLPFYVLVIVMAVLMVIAVPVFKCITRGSGGP